MASKRARTVDITREDVRDAEGARITDQYIDRAVERARQHAGRGGRPSVGAPGTRSPQLAVRLPAALKAAVEARAARDGKRPSDIAREALEQYLAG